MTRSDELWAANPIDLWQYLVAIAIDEVYEVDLPDEVRRVLSVFSIAVSFGISGVGSVLECLNFHGQSLESPSS